MLAKLNLPRLLLVLLAAVAGSVAEVSAATRVVSNCNDSGAGSLRDAVARAASGDTIDARALQCTTVSLQSQIAVPQASLTIVGPGKRGLTIDGNFADRLYLHGGAGTLKLQGMTLARGRDYVQTALGGCIRSLGNVTLDQVHMHQCRAEGRRPPDYDGAGAGASAGGGAIHAAGDVWLVFSEVHDSWATTFTGYGGGIAARTLTMYASRLHRNDAHDGGGASVARFHATYSLVDHNTATDYGGVRAREEAFVLRSTLADNAAFGHCGGLCVDANARIVDSTISRNMAGSGSAGAFSGDVDIHNSTIADNREHHEPTGAGCAAAITRLDWPYLGPYRMHIESSVVAANRCRDGTAARDIEGRAPSTLDEGDTITGARNLIGTSNLPLPADTIHANPRLAALADNGGPTPTQRLASDSPALNRGNNVLGLSNDQRGPGHPRTKGVGTDIGAYER